jgi:hypothetical protein
MSIGARSAGRHRAFTIPKVAERMAAIDDGMRHRESAFTRGRATRALEVPSFPTTTIGSFPSALASDTDALMFPIMDPAAACAVHRRAFRTLLGFEPAASIAR